MQGLAQKARLYRFQVGDNVLCKTGGGRTGWEPGRIVRLNYTEPGDTDVHPYQVMLNDGDLIYCPIDEDSCCRKYVVPWWEALLARQDLSDEEGVDALTALSKSQDINAVNYLGDSALHTCICYNWVPGIERLLELRADPNLGGQGQARALIMAVRGGWRFLVKMLLEAQADPSLQDEDPEKDPSKISKTFEERQWHRSALHYASMYSKDLTAVLLEARADINQADAQSKQPLHLAIEEDRIDVVDLLLGARADVNTGNMSMGFSSNPLIEAIRQNNDTLVQKLVFVRADINRQGKQGMTPLHMAARCKHVETVRLLVEANADLDIQAMGKTAAQLAAKNGAMDIARLLGYQDGTVGDCIGAAQTRPVLDAELRKQLYID